MRWSLSKLTLSILLSLSTTTNAYQAVLSSNEFVRQACSGMWKKTVGIQQDPFIEVMFSEDSAGEASVVFYEWGDSQYLGSSRRLAEGEIVGKRQVEDIIGEDEEELADENIRYVCDMSAVQDSYCTQQDLGKFIVSLPEGTDINDTTIVTTPVSFPSGPVRYDVGKTGYYCVGIVPLSPQAGGGLSQNETSPDQSVSATYTAVIDYENVFKGYLPAAEYPKIPLYLGLTIVYLLLGLIWAVMCIRHREDILSIQHYVSVAFGIIIVEMIISYAYYQAVNRSTNAALSKGLLVTVSILNAARNTMSLFVLCLVCMGYGVVRTNLGRAMTRVRVLAILHFVFGVAETLGTVLVPVEQAGFFILAFIIPSSLSLTFFIVWTLMSLNVTIADLKARKQMFKLKMYKRLDRILIGTIIALFAFFVILGFAFSSRFEIDYEARTWKTRWILLDGYLAFLYLLVFCAIAYLWRPNSNNRRLAMSDEIATEDDLDDVEMDNAHQRSPDPERRPMNNDNEVVFDIGASDDEDEEDETSRLAGSKQQQQHPPGKDRTD